MVYFLTYFKLRIAWYIIKIKYILCRNDEKYVKKIFLKYHGYNLDIRNPKTIDEKISINMFNDDSDLKRKLSDKVLVRDYVIDKGLDRILIKPFYFFKTTKNIDFKKIDFDAVLKTNNCSGYIIKYYRNVNRVSKFQLKCLDFLKKQNYYLVHREKNYDKIKGTIIVEKMLNFENENIDYKFFCFNGKIEFVFLEHGIYDEKGNSREYKRNIVDENFKEIHDFKETREGIKFQNIVKPINWDDMCFCAKTLSKNINFVRVDLYSVCGKTYFGEMTFYHGAGNNKWYPLEKDLEYAKKINLIK